MIDTLDESDIKKKLLADLQNQMAGRRASPLLTIGISGPAAVSTDEDDTSENLEDGQGEQLAEGGELDEPTDVKGRLGKMLRSKGMID